MTDDRKEALRLANEILRRLVWTYGPSLANECELLAQELLAAQAEMEILLQEEHGAIGGYSDD